MKFQIVKSVDIFSLNMLIMELDLQHYFPVNDLRIYFFSKK